MLVTLITSTKFLINQATGMNFSHIFIDEAGTCLEVDCSITVAIANRIHSPEVQLVLAGDHKQLGPTVKYKVLENISGMSLMERLMTRDTYQKDVYGNYDERYVVKLCRNYRSPPNVIAPGNELFYENELIPMLNEYLDPGNFQQNCV